MSDPPRVVLLEARMESELANLARRHGLDPVSAPALREETADCGDDVNALIDELARGDMDYDPERQLIVRARLHGTGELQRFSRNHLLFTVRQLRQPTLQLTYTCEPIDTPPLSEPGASATGASR